jgi:hypothetical protein
MKMFGLGITKENNLFVMRDHRSRGCPHVFWKHNYKCKYVEYVNWEVGMCDDVDVARRVLKNPIPLGYIDYYDESSLSHGLELHPLFKTYKELLRECLVVTRVDDQSSLIAALNKYKDQESRLKEFVNADEELKPQDLEVKERRAKKNRAVEEFLETDPRLECVR